jgi:hypothetical protein
MQSLPLIKTYISHTGITVKNIQVLQIAPKVSLLLMFLNI